MIGIQVSDLTKTYRTSNQRIQALDRVTFRVEPGAFVALIGYSGCGKTTLFRHIAGLERPDRGETSFYGSGSPPIGQCPGVGMMFQEPRLLAWLTVRQNLLLALRRTSIQNPLAAVEKSLKQVGLGDFGSAYPDQLSGGMAQRVALARALCREPPLLLMDEPFGALDALTRAQLQEELVRIWVGRPMTVLFITHDISEAVALADRVLIMAEGRVVGDRRVPFPRPRQGSDPEVDRLRKDILETILNKTYTRKEKK